MKKTLAKVAVASMMFGGLLGLGTAPATAACNSNPNAGVYYYDTTTCGTLIYSANGYTAPNSFGSNNNKISSVNQSRATGGGSWRAYLYGGIGHNNLLIGLSNASTTSGKSWNLANYADGVNNNTDSICQDRVIGSYSAAECLTGG